MSKDPVETFREERQARKEVEEATQITGASFEKAFIPASPEKIEELKHHIRAVTKVDSIARVCHEVNRAYCASLNDHSHVEWDNCPDWQKDSAREGVRFKLDNPLANAKELHRNWMKDKLADGWQWGAVKDPERKEHPCMVPYSSLSLAQRTKDELFGAIVEAMR